jgi:hypothetical protein
MDVLRRLVAPQLERMPRQGFAALRATPINETACLTVRPGLQRRAAK